MTVWGREPNVKPSVTSTILLTHCGLRVTTNGCTPGGLSTLVLPTSGSSNFLTDFRRKEITIMPMKIKLSTFLLGGTAFAMIGGAFALAQAVDPRIQQYDKGPATINVSGYPAAAQQDYTLFTQKCSQCHKLSRPINS